MNTNYNNFLYYVLLFTIICFIPVILNILFLYNAGENSGFDEIVRLQINNNAIYGTSLNQNTFLYKLDMVKIVKPVIIALGSSMVMQFREESFLCSFVNCGGAMKNLKEGRLFIEKMLLFHKPKLIIVGIDFWWFNQNIEQSKDFSYHDNNGKTLTINKLIKPFAYIWEDKITIKDYLNILLNRRQENNITKYYNIGLRAIKTAEGYRKDGSMLFSSILFGCNKGFADKNFKDTLGRIKEGTRKMEYGKNISTESIAEFYRIVKLCKDHNIDVIYIIPPLSYTAYNRMQSMVSEYSYVSKLRNYIKLSLKNYEFYDFQNILDVGSDDCECIDGFHCGDVTYQKILLKICQNNPNSIIIKYLNIDLIKNTVIKYKGRALSLFNDNKFKLKEVDYLGIGCKK